MLPKTRAARNTRNSDLPSVCQNKQEYSNAKTNQCR